MGFDVINYVNFIFIMETIKLKISIQLKNFIFEDCSKRIAIYTKWKKKTLGIVKMLPVKSF